VKTGDGRTFLLYNNAFHLENHIFWLGIENYPWERTSRKIWTILCQSAGTILDIGANSGIYSVLASVYHPGARIIAFEPQPNVYRVLQKNNAINGFSIRCELLALSDREGILPFYNYGPDTFTTENTTAGSLNRDWGKGEQSSIMVRVCRLEKYLHDQGLTMVDLMKIDVETHECEVLKGYGRMLNQHKPIIFLEIQNREIGEKIESLFPGSGYFYYRIIEGKGLGVTVKLGDSQDILNYLICPQSKQDLLNGFIVT
jgi:FkbM family methyltransferase